MLINCPDCGTPVSCQFVRKGPIKRAALSVCSNCGSRWEVEMRQVAPPKFTTEELKDRRNRPT